MELFESRRTKFLRAFFLLFPALLLVLSCTLFVAGVSSTSDQAVHKEQDALEQALKNGAIEQDADVIMFLYRDEYYNANSEDKGIAECIVSKNRHGETGAVKLQWMPQFQLFADREWKHAE